MFENDHEFKRGPPNFEVVRTLLSGSQEAVTLEDIDDMTPLEYAIVSDAPIKVVKILQKVTQKQEQKKRGNSPPASPKNVMEQAIRAA